MQRLREKGRGRVALQSSVDWRRGAVPPATTRSHHQPHPAARSRRIWRIPDRW